MALAFLNRCVFRAASSGTGSFVVASAITGYRIPADCTNPAAVDGATYRYFAQSDDLTQWEIGYDDFNAGSSALPRGNILDSSNAGAIVTFSAAPSVFMGGAQASEVSATGVTPGSYTNANVTIDQQGRVTNAANGTGGGGGLSALTITKTGNITFSPDPLNIVPAQAVQFNTGVFTSASGVWVETIGLLGDATLLSQVNLAGVTGALSISAMPNLTAFSLPALVFMRGSLTIGGDMGSLVTLDVPELLYVFADVTINGLAVLGTLSLPALQIVSGSMLVDSLDILTELVLPDLVKISGLSISGTPLLPEIDLPSLEESETISVISLAALTTFTAPSLVTGGVSLSNEALLDTVDLSALTTAGALGFATLPSLVTLAFPVLTVAEFIEFTDVAALETLDLTALEEITSYFSISSAPLLASLDLSALTSVDEAFTIVFCAAMTTLDVSALNEVGEEIHLRGLAITTLDFDALEECGSFEVNDIDALTAINCPGLESVNGNFNPHDLIGLVSIDVSALASVSGNFEVKALPSLTTLNVSALASVAGDISLLDLTVITSVDFTSLAIVGAGGSLEAKNCPALTSLTFPAITNINDTLILTTNTAAVDTYTLGSGLLELTGGVLFTSCALLEASVDDILVRLAALDGTGGTTSYDNQSIEITGTSATPSATGLVAKATLELRGNTVTVN